MAARQEGLHGDTGARTEPDRVDTTQNGCIAAPCKAYYAVWGEEGSMVQLMKS